jgi:hypothetical protein
MLIFLARFCQLSVVFLLAGCQLIQVEQAVFVPSHALVYNKKSEHVFNPHGKELFMLKSKAGYFQKQGYTRFCQNTDKLSCNNKLPYLRFTGMRGYFDQREPVKTDNQTYEYYPVVLENGDKYFFLSLRNAGGKYGKASPIKSLSLDNTYQEQPAIVGSAVKIIGEYKSFGNRFYQLSNDTVIETKQLEFIRDISAQYPHKPKMSHLLLNTAIEYNPLYKSYLIQPKLSASHSQIKLVIGLDEDNPWLRLNVSHKGKDQLDINAYSIVADDLLWRSPVLKFEIQQLNGQFHEFFNITANARELDNVSAMSKASRAMIRLHGTKKSTYSLLKATEKKQLINIITLYQWLKKADQS